MAIQTGKSASSAGIQFNVAENCINPETLPTTSTSTSVDALLCGPLDTHGSCCVISSLAPTGSWAPSCGRNPLWLTATAGLEPAAPTFHCFLLPFIFSGITPGVGVHMLASHLTVSQLVQLFLFLSVHLEVWQSAGFQHQVLGYATIYHPAQACRAPYEPSVQRGSNLGISGSALVSGGTLPGHGRVVSAIVHVLHQHLSKVLLFYFFPGPGFARPASWSTIFGWRCCAWSSQGCCHPWGRGAAHGYGRGPHRWGWPPDHVGPRKFIPNSSGAEHWGGLALAPGLEENLWGRRTQRT